MAGSQTVSVNAVAIAASTAFPPLVSISAPAALAQGWEELLIPPLDTVSFSAKAGRYHGVLQMRSQPANDAHGRALAQLQQLGLSGYEGKAYLSLLAAPEALNGYELAKASGVPRSTVYEVIDEAGPARPGLRGEDHRQPAPLSRPAAGRLHGTGTKGTGPGD